MTFSSSPLRMKLHLIPPLKGERGLSLFPTDRFFQKGTTPRQPRLPTPFTKGEFHEWILGERCI